MQYNILCTIKHIFYETERNCVNDIFGSNYINCSNVIEDSDEMIKEDMYTTDYQIAKANSVCWPQYLGPQTGQKERSKVFAFIVFFLTLGELIKYS